MNLIIFLMLCLIKPKHLILQYKNNPNYKYIQLRELSLYGDNDAKVIFSYQLKNYFINMINYIDNFNKDLRNMNYLFIFFVKNIDKITDYAYPNKKYALISFLEKTIKETINNDVYYEKIKNLIKNNLIKYMNKFKNCKENILNTIKEVNNNIKNIKIIKLHEEDSNFFLKFFIKKKTQIDFFEDLKSKLVEFSLKYTEFILDEQNNSEFINLNKFFKSVYQINYLLNLSKLNNHVEINKKSYENANIYFNFDLKLLIIYKLLNISIIKITNSVNKRYTNIVKPERNYMNLIEELYDEIDYQIDNKENIKTNNYSKIINLNTFFLAKNSYFIMILEKCIEIVIQIKHYNNQYKFSVLDEIDNYNDIRDQLISIKEYFLEI